MSELAPSSVQAFIEALNGGKGDLDAWLECNNEAEVRAHIRACLAAPPAAPAPGDMVMVPLKFVQDFNTLAHNYCLRAVPPDYYSGTEADAFQHAYSRCGSDLRRLREILAAAPAPAAKAAEIAQLREYLDAAQRRGEELRAQVAALTENGPPMQRGTTIEGTPWMGTMREVLEDYKSAADTEARWGDEARAEVAGLRKALAAAIRQNEHDMLMTGEELRAARAALGDKTP